MKEWIVSTVEQRRYNVDYFLQADSEEGARVALEAEGTFLDEDARLDYVVSRCIKRVAECK